MITGCVFFLSFRNENKKNKNNKYNNELNELKRNSINSLLKLYMDWCFFLFLPSSSKTLAEGAELIGRKTGSRPKEAYKGFQTIKTAEGL